MISSESVFREHLEEGDANLQKIREAALPASPVVARREAGTSVMSDSELGDEEYHHRPKSKKGKVAGGKLEDLDMFSTPVCSIFLTRRHSVHDEEIKAF